MSRIIRILAVIALALSPVWGYQADVAASVVSSPARYPVWPSFASTGCSALQGPGGSTSISCGQGSFLLSQVAIGYTCNQLDISVSSFQSGSFLVVGTALDGTQNNTLTIDGTGNYFMQFPQPLVQNLVTLQMTAGGNGAVMTVQSITGSPCAVSTSTPTVNPSFTPTDTAVPVTGTPTAIPTHTPLPSGHNTFTVTGTPAPGTNTATPTATPTAGPVARNCGTSDFPLLSCDPGFGSPSFCSGTIYGPQLPWNVSGSCGANLGWDNRFPINWWYAGNGVSSVRYFQIVQAHKTGSIHVDWFTNSAAPGDATTRIIIRDDTTSTNLSGSSNYSTQSGTCTLTGYPTSPPGNIPCTSIFTGATSGDNFEFDMTEGAGSTIQIYLDDVWMSAGGSLTPFPTSTATFTSTPVPGTATNTAIPTDTAIPIPGAMSTAIATSTECPGGCAVAALTDVPGIATRITVDTSPFSPFTSLSLARSDCKPFGYVQIPYPVIHGTPALGSSIPLSVTWTAPVTHDWDNSNPYSNTAIQPCAMDVINYINGTPTHIWDLTYWLSVLAIAIVFIMWLIGFVGRLSGDETING